MENPCKIANNGEGVSCAVKMTVFDTNTIDSAYNELSFADRCRHMLLLGPTGCGKTNMAILPLCCRDINDLNMGVTIMDTNDNIPHKAAMMAKLAGRQYLLFDPAMDDCPYLNPLVGPEDEVIEDLTEAYRLLRPDQPQHLKDLDEMAIRYGLRVLKRLDIDEGEDGCYCTFTGLYRLFMNSAGQGRELVNRFSRLPEKTQEDTQFSASIAIWFLNEYFSVFSKAYESLEGFRFFLSKLCSNPYLSQILNPEARNCKRPHVMLDEHVSGGGVLCISTAHGCLRELGSFIGRLILLRLHSSISRCCESNRTPHVLYLNEANCYVTQRFTQLLDTGTRYGIAIHIAAQCREVFGAGMGDTAGKRFVEQISTMPQNIILFPGICGKDAEFFENAFVSAESSVTKESIIYQPYGRFVCRLSKGGTIQQPVFGTVGQLDDSRSLGGGE